MRNIYERAISTSSRGVPRNPSNQYLPPLFVKNTKSVEIVSVYNISGDSFDIEFSKQVSMANAISLIFLQKPEPIVTLSNPVSDAMHQWRINSSIGIEPIIRYLKPPIFETIAKAQGTYNTHPATFNDFKKQNMVPGFTNGELIDLIKEGPAEVNGYFVWIGFVMSTFEIQTQPYLKDEVINRDIRWFLAKGENLREALKSTENSWLQVKVMAIQAFASTLSDVSGAGMQKPKQAGHKTGLRTGSGRFNIKLKRLAGRADIPIKRISNVGEVLNLGMQGYGALWTIKESIEHYVNNITPDEAEEEVKADAEAIHAKLRQVGSAKAAIPGTPVVPLISNKLKGKFGEKVAAVMLKARGYDLVISLQNKSDNGIDLIGVKTWGKGENKRTLILYFEIKTTERPKAKISLSKRQRNIQTFTREILGDIANRRGRYKKVSKQDRKYARKLLNMHHIHNIPIGGAIIDVKLLRGGIFGLRVKIAVRGRWTSRTRAQRGTRF